MKANEKGTPHADPDKDLTEIRGLTDAEIAEIAAGLGTRRLDRRDDGRGAPWPFGPKLLNVIPQDLVELIEELGIEDKHPEVDA